MLLKNSVSSFTLENNIISLQEARPEMGRSHTRAIKNELKDEGDRKRKRKVKKRGLKINKGRDAKRQASLFHRTRWQKWITPCLRELTFLLFKFLFVFYFYCIHGEKSKLCNRS